MFLQELPIFIAHKLIKVIVDIGRVDWPMFYPDFFQSLLQLTSSATAQQFGDTRALGLAALRIASEELVSPREDISVQRKEELKKLLSAQVPDIINVITGLLAFVDSDFLILVGWSNGRSEVQILGPSNLTQCCHWLATAATFF